jgi:hypothetical protein
MPEDQERAVLRLETILAASRSVGGIASTLP